MEYLSLSARVEQHIRDEYQLSDEKVATMLPTFLLIVQNHMHDLEQCIGSGDHHELAKAGHKLKGALLTLGLDDISELALHIEMAGKAKSRDVDLKKLLQELKERLEELL